MLDQVSKQIRFYLCDSQHTITVRDPDIALPVDIAFARGLSMMCESSLKDGMSFGTIVACVPTSCILRTRAAGVKVGGKVLLIMCSQMWMT